MNLAQNDQINKFLEEKSSNAPSAVAAIIQSGAILTENQHILMEKNALDGISQIDVDIKSRKQQRMPSYKDTWAYQFYTNNTASKSSINRLKDSDVFIEVSNNEDTFQNQLTALLEDISPNETVNLQNLKKLSVLSTLVSLGHENKEVIEDIAKKTCEIDMSNIRKHLKNLDSIHSNFKKTSSVSILSNDEDDDYEKDMIKKLDSLMSKFYTNNPSQRNISKPS